MKHSFVLRILGVILILSLLVTTIPVLPVMAAATILNVSPTYGPVGSVVNFAFTSDTVPSGQYLVYFSNTTVGTTQVAYGNYSAVPFSTSFPVPVLPGASYSVSAYIGGELATYSQPFVVIPKLTLVSSDTGKAGDQVTVNGNGFVANSGVTIKFDTTIVASATASATGVLADVTFAVPESKAGSHSITGSDSVATSPAVAFNVLPKMSITPTSGGVGDQVTVTGTGFDASKAVTVTFDGSPVTTEPASVATSDKGSFTAKFNVPAAGQGGHEVKASDASGYSLSATFTIGAKITLTPTTGFAGDQVTVDGTGFGASKTITITFDGIAVTTNPTPVATGGSGGFSATFLVPAAAKGTHTIKAEESTTISATATFSVNEKITVSPVSGFVGDEVTASGIGFAASSTITVLFDTVSVATATATASGSFDALTFNVPAGIKGDHTIKIQDSAGNSATASFTISEEMAINPTTGFVGDQVTVDGTGFGANRSVTLYLDNVSVGTGNTDARGNLSGSFTIPASSRGDHTVKVQDSSGNSATATLTVKNQMVMTPLTGALGTTVTVNGTGFIAGSQILISFNNNLISTDPLVIMADASGSFSGNFNVPGSPAGDYVVGVSDGTNSSSASFTVLSAATISPVTSEKSPGHVGMEVTIVGTGFKADATITLTYESEPIVLGTTTTDATGTFSVAIIIPASAGGQHTITASDGTTTKQFTFVMESVPPPAPTPLLPPTGSKPKQPVSFDWGDVTDESLPVTYTFQIATDQDFASIVLEQAGLTQSQYTLTEEERLDSRSKKEPYYWRVRAVDGAQNVSLWSEVSTFGIGFIWPDWIIYVWFGLGVVIIGLLAFWLGRRSAYASY